MRDCGVPVSIDTRKPEVMREALAHGADIINDVGGFTAPGAIEAVAASACGVCIMHMQGDPQTMQRDPTYSDVVEDIRAYLTARVAVCRAAGIASERIAVDPGIVVNPLQLKRQIEGGALMGLSHALYEEATFDESAVTSRDWRTYPVLTMADIPEIKVVILPRPEVGSYGGGSEAANALAISAIAAAFHDATGKVARRLPLRPAYVQSVLKA